MDEIRTEVWDYLYKNGPASWETIAAVLGQTVQTIQAATVHEWFVTRDDVVAIAVHEAARVESRGEETRSSEEASSQILRSLFSSEDRTSER